jgi:CRISPR-associated protein Cas2
MVTWVLYDIENDKARTKIAKTCRQAGLYRVQLSCFLGTLQIEALINEDVDKVYIFPMNKSELQQSILLGQAFDKKLVTDEIRMLFL